LVAAVCLLAPQVYADEAAPADAQAVVVKQINAFERSDDASAWSLAAPEIHNKFTSAEEFAGMVKERYSPVYHHRSVEFGPAVMRGDDVGVVVTLVSEDNEVWSALFVVSKQGDGKWRTSSCLLEKASQTSL
jgi:hypothetical protein